MNKINQQETLNLLQGFGYNATEYNGTVQVYEDERTVKNKLTAAEINAACQYKLDLRMIKKVDDWTFVIMY